MANQMLQTVGIWLQKYIYTYDQFYVEYLRVRNPKNVFLPVKKEKKNLIVYCENLYN